MYINERLRELSGLLEEDNILFGGKLSIRPYENDELENEVGEVIETPTTIYSENIKKIIINKLKNKTINIIKVNLYEYI